MSTKTKGILAYLLITFAGAWTIWLGLWLLGLSPTRTSLQLQQLSLPVEFAPAIAAVTVTGEVALLPVRLGHAPLRHGHDRGSGCCAGSRQSGFFLPPGMAVVLLGLVTFPVLTVLLSIIFGWLRLRTGSIWSASLAHAAFDSIGGAFTGLLFLGGADFALVGSNGVLTWIPLGAVCAWIVFTGQLQRETG